MVFSLGGGNLLKKDVKQPLCRAREEPMLLRGLAPEPPGFFRHRLGKSSVHCAQNYSNDGAG